MALEGPGCRAGFTNPTWRDERQRTQTYAP